ncbi:MAG: restriction endonuclease [Anaerolineae bacterium]|nr:restriction endonuclease [Anaerolineae bacterium]
MTVPTYDKCMLPLLQFASDGREHHVREAIEELAEYFELSDADRRERIPSGKKFKFDDRVQWANTYLKKAGLLQSVRRGVFHITERGQKVLEKNPPYIDRDFLMQYPSFVEFQTKPQVSGSRRPADIPDAEEEQTPLEILESSYQTLRDELAQELLDAIQDNSPSFFEELVVELVVAMGYGGSVEDAGRAIGGPGDGGVDGIINEDKLGLDVIYIQAKKWAPAQVVGREVVDRFAGSMLRAGVSKGILITTSRFSRGAIEQVVDFKQQKIVLIDGETLANLMIDNGIGVTSLKTYTVSRIDSDYFTPA